MTFLNLQLIKLSFKTTGLPLINISIFYTFSFQYTYKNLGPLLHFWPLLLAPKLFNGKHFEPYFLGIKKPRFKLKKCDLNNTQLNYCPNRYTCLTLKSVNRVRLLTHRSFSFKQFNYNLASPSDTSSVVISHRSTVSLKILKCFDNCIKAIT